MCRFVAYHGPRVGLYELLYEPEHSIIHQSTHASERKEPLNGDGWGVGWYDPQISPEPGLYRTLHPAWSDDNMRHVAPLLRTPVFLAHVRAASPGLPVQRLNCHPFQGGVHGHESPQAISKLKRARRRLLFMHNGKFGAYRALIRRLARELDDDLFFSIRGSTDSEHVFAAIQQQLGEAALDPDVEDLIDAVEGGLGFINGLKTKVGEGDEATHANFCITDGRSLVATRYTHPEDVPNQSLYVGTAGAFHCEDGQFHAEDPAGTGATLIASEALWNDDRVWRKVPENHAVLVHPDHSVELRALSVDTA